MKFGVSSRPARGPNPSSRQPFRAPAPCGHLGIVAQLERRLEDAETLLGRAVAMSQKAHALYGGCHFLAHLGAVRAPQGNRSDAMLDLSAVESALAGAEHVNPNLPAVLRILRALLDGVDAREHEPRAKCSSDVRIAARALARSSARPRACRAGRARGTRVRRSAEARAAVGAGAAVLTRVWRAVVDARLAVRAGEARRTLARVTARARAARR